MARRLKKWYLEEKRIGWGKNICQSVIEDGRNEHEMKENGMTEHGMK